MTNVFETLPRIGGVIPKANQIYCSTVQAGYPGFRKCGRPTGRGKHNRTSGEMNH